MTRRAAHAYVETFNTISSSLGVGAEGPTTEPRRTNHDPDESLRSVEALRFAARVNIGQLGVKEAQKTVRVEMFREALLREQGNRHAVARLLGVDRRYVLKMLKQDAIGPQRRGGG